MNDLVTIGNAIRDQRLALNLQMNEVAKQVGVSRATISALENGKGNPSINTIISILNVLSLDLDFNSNSKVVDRRKRAGRKNTALEKRINEFVIFCVEVYAESINKGSREVYKLLKEKNIILELEDDYEYLHGMSSEWLNDYIKSLLERAKS